jgi:malate dehydrogenase (oxaloacetate-decarboxylating)(NADP+)
VPYAHAFSGNKAAVAKTPEGGGDLLSIVTELRPSVIIGVSAQAGAFSQGVCEAMAEINDRPIIFALSNPTTLCEASPQDAYKWTNGKCIYSSGSPFPPVTLPDGRYFKPGQGNNAYIFPGLGLGCIISGSTHITDDDFLICSKALASMVTPADIEVGSVYPALDRIRDVSAAMAAAVAENVFATGRNTLPRPAGDLLEACKAHMYVPSY